MHELIVKDGGRGSLVNLGHFLSTAFDGSAVTAACIIPATLAPVPTLKVSDSVGRTLRQPGGLSGGG
jgi:hypothetical protein